jgi:predicted Zn-dependent protease with MMP-like domain
MSRLRTFSPDAATIERMVCQAIDRLPEEFRVHLSDVVVQIEDFADEEVLSEMGLDDPWQLTGLYRGRPIGEQSIWSSGDLPSMIHLFRRPLLEEWAETGVALEDLVAHVVIHEIGHHFGFSDEEMQAIEDGAR